MDLPHEKEQDEEMMAVPESLEFRSSTFLGCKDDHDDQGGRHDPAGDAAIEEIR